MDLLNRFPDMEPWLEYAIRINMLKEDRASLAPLKDAMLQNEKIKSWLTDIADFHSTVVTTHKNPGLSVNKLLFLLDLGLDRDVPQIAAAVNHILAHPDEHGVYQSYINVPKHFGGTGIDTFGWCLCDAPLLLTALLKAGIPYDERIEPGVGYLASLYQNGTFPCAVSPEFGKFRGPGRKVDCCPYATLVMLKLFACIPEYADSHLADSCAGTLLSLWEHSRNEHPYMFYMGTDFRKLKAPLIWYDIVSVTDVLSQFPRVHQDNRYIEMLDIIKSKMDADGLFTPESVYQKCRDWDFGQKKAPSPYLTYRCYQMLKRMNHA